MLPVSCLPACLSVNACCSGLSTAPGLPTPGTKLHNPLLTHSVSHSIFSTRTTDLFLPGMCPDWESNWRPLWFTGRCSIQWAVTPKQTSRFLKTWTVPSDEKTFIEMVQYKTYQRRCSMAISRHTTPSQTLQRLYWEKHTEKCWWSKTKIRTVDHFFRECKIL